MMAEVTTMVLVRPVGVLWSLQLHLESFHSNLEPVHGLDGRLCTRLIVEADETYTIANNNALFSHKVPDTFYQIRTLFCRILCSD